MNTDLIDIQNLAFSYPSESRNDDAWTLKVDRFAIPQRTICRILGNNMAGKTTLLRIIAGLEKVPVSSQLLISGLLSRRNHYQVGTHANLRTQSICFLTHNDRMFPDLTIWDNVRVACNCGASVDKTAARNRFKRYMGDVATLQTKSAKDHLGSLSSGGQALIRLARAYTWASQLILIDEVTSHLDDNNATTFFDYLRKLVKGECSIILVSHVKRDHDLAIQMAADTGTTSLAFSIEAKENISCLTAH